MENLKRIFFCGCAGSGKTTIATILSKELGYYLLDTGLIFRTLSFLKYQRETDNSNYGELIKILNSLDITKNGFLKVGLQVIEPNMLKSEKIAEKASILSSDNKIKSIVSDFTTRLINQKENIIVIGRNPFTIGVEFDFIIFVNTDLEIRAKRRAIQLNKDFNEIKNFIKNRDENDLKTIDEFVGKAFFVDNNASIDLCIDKIISIIESRN